MPMHAEPIRGRRASFRGSMAFAPTLAAILLVATLPATADHRPFGVLPEGALEITIDPTFDAGIELTGGRVVVSGDFDRVSRRPPGTDVVLLDVDGSRVPGFSPRCAVDAAPGASSRPCRGPLLALPDGGFLMAGDFGAVDGVAARGVARFDANGQRVAGYDPLANTPGRVTSLALIGDQVYAALSHGTSASLRRFGLAIGAEVDPGFQFPQSATRIVADDAGRPFVLSGGAVHRLDPATGAIDGAWTSGLAGSAAGLDHDPMSNRLFTIEWTQGMGVLRRLDPSSPVGFEPDWIAQEADPSVVWASAQVLGGAGAGRVVVTESIQIASTGFRTRQRVLASADGSVVRAIDGTPFELLSRRSSAGWLTGRPDVRLTDADVWPAPGFEPRIRRAAGVNDVARAPDGRLAIVGTMTRVEELARSGVARLRADLTLDRRWPAIGIVPASPCGNSTACVRARVGIGLDGAVVAIDHLIGSPVIFPPGPQPRAVVIDASGQNVRYRSSNRGEITAAPDGTFYLAPPEPTCPSPAGSGRLGRATLANLLAVGCTADPSWGDASASALARPVLSADGGFVYFAVIDQFNSSFVDWRVQRIATHPGAIVDPDFEIRVRTSVETWFRLALAVDGDDLYVADRIVAVNGQPWTGPARFDRHTGQPDPNWQPGVDRRVVRIAAGGGYVYLMRSTVASAPNQPALPIEIVRQPRAASPASEEVLATNGVFEDRSVSNTRTGQLIALDDGRAIVAGHFSEIGGVPRDGFAIVGSVEGMLADGFEAP